MIICIILKKCIEKRSYKYYSSITGKMLKNRKREGGVFIKRV